MPHKAACTVAEVQHCKIRFEGNEQYMSKKTVLGMLGRQYESIRNAPPIIFDPLPDKISYRFLPRSFATVALFSTDVDVFYSCDALKALYSVWRDNPYSAVGFQPQNITIPHQSVFEDIPFSELGNLEIWSQGFVAPFPRNMLFVTKGGMQHRDAFQSFFSLKYRKLRSLVEQKITGEDYLMGIVQAAELDPAVQLVCIDLADSCHMDCHEGSKELGVSTSGQRPFVLWNIGREVGNPLHSQVGSGNITWLGSSCQKQSGTMAVPVLCPSRNIEPLNMDPCLWSFPELRPGKHLRPEQTHDSAGDLFWYPAMGR